MASLDWRPAVSYAIKEYFAGQTHQLQTCLKEAAVIHRHRHPAIVQIKALFQGSGSEHSNFYMQMPWYEKGALGAWAAGESRPPWTQVRSVLLDALQGLAHLHANGVIHGDVKPANILVDGLLRGRLAAIHHGCEHLHRSERLLVDLLCLAELPHCALLLL